MLAAVLALSGCFGIAYGETVMRTMEGGMDVKITYPKDVIAGRTFSLSVLVQNNGWEDKQDVSFAFSADNAITPTSGSAIEIPLVSQDGSYGRTADFAIDENAAPGTYFINIEYSQVLLANNQEPQEPTGTNIAIPVVVRESAAALLHVTSPESLFAGAEFPITVEFVPDADISNVRLQIVPPMDIEFRGETQHLFSSVSRDEQVGVTSILVIPDQDVTGEHVVPLSIRLSYSDDAEEEYEISETVSMILRPRTFMELTGDGGIWVGDFFIAPYVSLGTIVGIPMGAIVTLLIRRSYRSGRRRSRK